MEEKQNMIFYLLPAALIIIAIGLTAAYLATRRRAKSLEQENRLLKARQEQEQSLLLGIIKTQEEERHQIAANLHDSVGAELSMLKLNLSKYVYFLRDSDFDTDHLMEDIKGLDVTIENIRGVCRDLYPKLLVNYGFIKLFHEMCERLGAAGPVACMFTAQLAEAELQGFSHKLDLFRICKEVLNNIVRHAQCTQLQVSIARSGQTLHISFAHNGIAFANSDAEANTLAHKGTGLAGIKNRLGLVKGKIDYLATDHGAEIKIGVPLNG